MVVRERGFLFAASDAKGSNSLVHGPTNVFLEKGGLQRPVR